MNRHAWLLLVRNQFLGFVREPAAAGFNLAIPFFIVVVQAIAYGQTVIGSELPGYKVVDVLPVAAGTMFVMIIGIFGMGIGLASMIEARSLAAFRFRPGGIKAIVAAYSSVLGLLIVLGLALSTATLAIVWGIRSPDRPFALVAAVLLGTAFFLGVGAVSAALGGSPRSAQAVSSGIFFPLLFLSGAMFPLDDYPVALKVISQILPGRHIYDLFLYGWVHDQSFPIGSAIYVTIGAVFTCLVGVRLLNRREAL